MNKIEVKISNLRLREKANLKAKQVGLVEKGYHVYSEKALNDGYLWYHIEDGWCANVDNCIVELDDPDLEIIWKEIKEIKEMMKSLIESKEVREVKALSQADYNKADKKDNVLYLIKG